MVGWGCRTTLATLGPLLLREVLPVAAGCRPALPLVLRAERRAAVGPRRRLAELHERDLADLHLVVDRDREVRDVRQLERDMAVPAGIDEAGGRVDQQAETPERALAFEAGDEVVREPDALEGRAEHEFAGMQDERLVTCDLDLLGQLLLRLLDVDERIARVVEDPEVPVGADVDAGRLQQPLVIGVDADATFVDEPGDRAIGQDHGRFFHQRLGEGAETLQKGFALGVGERCESLRERAVAAVDPGRDLLLGE